MRCRNKGFTLVELMVTVSVVSILAVIVYANVGGSRPKARDLERQADLRSLETAIIQYKQKYKRFPEIGCPNPPDADGVYTATETNCSTYVKNLSPEFITVLPKDPNLNGKPGYTYITNADGTVFKIMAQETVESEIVTVAHPMKRCSNTNPPLICGGGGPCFTDSNQYKKSYALWGGYANELIYNDVKYKTGLVICK